MYEKEAEIEFSAHRKNEKLSQRYFGPYQVISRVARVAYKLKLPEHSKIHPVFYISQLKVAVPTLYTPHELPKIMTPSLEWATKPEKLLDIRKAEQGEGAEGLVQWVGLSALESTWEPLTTLVHQFSNFDLEDKVSLLRGTIDRFRVLSCMRRKLRSGGRKAKAMEKFLRKILMKSG
ncbi:Chromo-like domain superfamily [Arabidopsis suecica]|uniref:Chromo-like domain superfamily n=1 Tax=Arabidopsis suecica TaxID=45249 RepID=A0A8T1XW10_ARASU|nr:Chromo-like domain superfamily [Arabidopsis suecica]